MDLRQLNALLAVAEHQSFSAAARALHTVQSNVSTHVAHLEREVGARLIDRDKGSLTPEGEIVADRARRIQVELRAIQDDLVSLREDLAGTVRTGVIGTTARWLVPLLLEEAHRRHPRLEVIVVDATTTSLVPLLVRDRLDLAVVNLPVDDPDIETEPLFSEDRVALAPEGHELARRDRVALAELARHPVLLPPQGTAFRDEVDDDASEAGLELRPRAEIDGLSLLMSLAAQGFAPALLPASATHGMAAGPWRSAVVEGLGPRVVGLARNRRTAPSAPARTVAEMVREVVEAEAPNQPHIYVAERMPAPPDPRATAAP